MSKKVKILLIVLCLLMFLVSAAVVAYPLVSNYLAEQRQAAVITSYDEAIGAAQAEEITTALHDAKAYNTALANGQTEGVADYDRLLNPTGSGVMGIISIPAIGVELPIYHGTQSLELGALHLQGTSLPVGGDSTHCVISAHSGMSSEKMFTDLEQLSEGDVFHLSVLGQKLFYEVDQILTVLPDDTVPLRIVQGEDCCTLLTCTPYGVNTHRLLVRGHRVPTPETAEDAPVQTVKQSTWMRQYLRGILVGLCIVISAASLLLLVFLPRRRKRQ